MSTLAVGTIIPLTFACAIDDPSRFTLSKQVGPYFGLTPKKYQSGETDYTGRISGHGDASARGALYEAAHLLLTKPMKGCIFPDASHGGIVQYRALFVQQVLAFLQQ